MTGALIARGLPHTDDGANCPDPSLLACLHEGSAAADETERWMTHLAGCRRCQATLGALARAEHGARPDHRPAPHRWMQIRRLLRWPVLAPLAAGAVVVLAVWVSTPGTSPAPFASRAEIAADATGATSELPGPVAGEPAEQPLAESRLDLARLDEAEDAAEPEAEPQRARRPPAARLDRMDVPPEEPSAAIAPSANVGTVAAVSAVADPSVDTPPLVAQEAAALSDAVLVPSPRATLQWRARSGTIARTDDGGLNWRTQLTVPERVVAGAAPSVSVAWLVGERGIVMRTIDGEQWTRLPPPAPVSLIAVDASDGLRATVTTEDGRQFRTDDAGTTWVLVQ